MPTVVTSSRTLPHSDGLRRARAADRLPGDPGVWVFIAADMAAFALFFLAFAAGRLAAPALYEKSRQALDPAIGLLNTLILLTSGWLMVQAVAAGRDGDRPRVLRFLALTVLVGCGFALTKVLEYATKIRAGITMLTNEFFMYYFILTGIHFLHFVIGIIVLVVCLMKARREPLDARFTVWIESAGSYWHMVDLLWIVLFPLLYLLR